MLLIFLKACYNKIKLFWVEKRRIVLAICAFFGHRNFLYQKYENRISAYIMELITEKNVVQFYSGFRGDFDRLCAKLVYDIKFHYPHIVNTMVLSYHPKSDFMLPSYFDDSVYLLEKDIPPRFAITYTNRKIVDLSDYIISGALLKTGGAADACKYAISKKKVVLSIF